MNQDVVINLVMKAVTVAVKVALPILLARLVVGLLVSIFQAITTRSSAMTTGRNSSITSRPDNRGST